MMGTGERALKIKQAFHGSPTPSSWQMRCRTAQVREQSRRNADFLEFEFPGSPGPVLLLNPVAKKGEVVRGLVSERRPLFSEDCQRQDHCPHLGSHSDQDTAGEHGAACGSWARAWPRRVLEAS